MNNASIKEREEAIQRRNDGSERIYQTNHQTAGPNLKAKTKKRGIYVDVEKQNGKYVVKFKYADREDAEHIRNFVENELIPSYGVNSYRDKKGLPVIIPTLVDEHGYLKTTPDGFGMVSEMIVPEDMINDVVKRLVEFDGAVVKIGGKVLVDKFESDGYQAGLREINKPNDKKDKTPSHQNHEDIKYNY